MKLWIKYALDRLGIHQVRLSTENLPHCVVLRTDLNASFGGVRAIVKLKQSPRGNI